MCRLSYEQHTTAGSDWLDFCSDPVLVQIGYLKFQSVTCHLSRMVNLPNPTFS